MASNRRILALTAFISLAASHYTFVRIAHNGEWQAPLKFIRNKTSPFNETYYAPNLGGYTRLFNYPTLYDDSAESMRCGRDNLLHAAATDTLKVKAGDEIEFAHQRWDPYDWTDDMWYACWDNRGTCYFGDGQDINHPGPVIAHLSQVPKGQDIRTYDGSGSWTKIWTMGFEYRASRRTPIFWLAYNDRKTDVPRFNFTIPKKTPAGQYLLRMDLIFAALRGNSATSGQMYPSCAQIEVISETTGSLPEGVHIPDVMSPGSPGTYSLQQLFSFMLTDIVGMTLSPNMYNLQSVDQGYTYPGGPIWDGEKLIADQPPSQPRSG